MICGARLPSPLREREPDWDPESGIRLAGKTVYHAPHMVLKVESHASRDIDVKSRYFGIKIRDQTENQ